MSAPRPAVILRGVSFTYGHGLPVLREIDMRVEHGERLGICGPNGGGKTTLLRLLLGLLEPCEGSIEVFGLPPKEARPRIGYVPQLAALDESVPATARDVVLTGCLRRGRWGPRFSLQERRRGREALARLGLGGFADRRLSELSGGQRQRVLLARALVAEPDLLLLDEPTCGVDAENREALLTALDELRGLTLMLVSHDEGLLSTHLDRVIRVARQAEIWRPQTLEPAAREARSPLLEGFG